MTSQNKIEKQNYINNKHDKRISFYIIFYFIAITFNGTIKNVLSISESYWSTLSIITGVAIVLTMLLNIKIVYERSSKILFFSFFIFLFLYSVSVIQATIFDYPIKFIWKYSAFIQFAWWIPVGVFAYSIYNKRILYEVLLKGSYFISAILTLSFILFVMGKSSGHDSSYNMFFSYSMLLPILLHISEFFRQKKILMLFLAIVETFQVLIYGARGPLFMVIIFILIMTFFFIAKLKKVYVLILVLIGLIAYLNFNTIIFDVNNHLNKYGINSRTLSLIISDEISNKSSREIIWSASEQLILEKPILGYGLGNEYYAIGKRVNVIEDTGIVSPHNGLIQLMLNFGLIIGGALGFFIIISFFKSAKIKDFYLRVLLFVFFTAYIIPSITVGDGIFTKPGVAVYIYLFIGEFYRNKSKIKKMLLVAN